MSLFLAYDRAPDNKINYFICILTHIHIRILGPNHQNKKGEKVFSIVKCRMSQTEKRNKRWIKSKFLFWTKLKRSHWIWYLPFILIIVDILFVALRCLCNALSHFLSFPPLFLDGIRFDKYARLRRTVSVNCLFRMVVVFFYLSLWTLDRQCVVPVHVLCISSVYFS